MEVPALSVPQEVRPETQQRSGAQWAPPLTQCRLTARGSSRTRNRKLTTVPLTGEQDRSL